MNIAVTEQNWINIYDIRIYQKIFNNEYENSEQARDIF